MTRNRRSYRNHLFLGASLGSLILAAPALSQNLGAIRAAANPAAQAAQAAQNAGSRNADAAATAARVRASLQNAARIRTQMDAAQRAARAAALAAQSTIPNGLGQGGLQPSADILIDPSLWVGANRPVQSQGQDGRTLVTVDQNKDKAILTWDSFNVGRETDLLFDHHGNTNWITLNRVTDVNADPSKILGSIKADGSVYILNRNGVIFGGSSQVNVRNLVAATTRITNEHFEQYGINSRISADPSMPWLPPSFVDGFTDAGGDVLVEAGARLTTSAPKTVVESGGFVMLLGKRVENAGSIITDRGQTILAAGDSFTIRAGYGTDANQISTTRGNEIAVNITANSTSGDVINSGLIEARQGDITLAGERVTQGGVALATSSVHTRGTIHLLTNVGNAAQATSVTLTANSLTMILPELESLETATNAQRDALIAPLPSSNTASLNNQGQGNLQFRQPDRPDLGRIEIMTGGSAVFEGGSNTIAQGGQIAVMARTRTFVGEGAVLDVSGVRDVAMDMESNTIKVNIQPFEMRDSAPNREVEALKTNDIWIDVRDLILLPSGTGGHDGDRYYTPGGLLEVGGHLGNTAHRIGEWVANAGTITFTSGQGSTTVIPPDVGQLIIQKGAILDISGGSLDYAAGYVRSTLFMGSDGRLYTAGTAPADVKLVSVGASFMRQHGRWGERYNEVFVNPFARTLSTRWEEGYTVGRDAGVLSLSVPTVVMEGTVLADVIIGQHQTQARPDLPITTTDTGGISGNLNKRLDGYKLPQTVTPLAGGLYVGNQLHVQSSSSNPNTPFATDVSVSAGTDMTGGMTSGTILTPAQIGTVQLSADSINQANLGELRISGADVRVESALSVANGGKVMLRGENVSVQGDITAHSGTISIEGIVVTCPYSCDAIPTNVEIADGVKLDTTGLWVNLKTGGDRRDLAHLDGGDILISSRQGSLRMGAGSLIDASAGGAILELGETVGANGGNVLLSTGDLPREAVNEMVLGGAIRSYGSGTGVGGTLILNNGGRAITIGQKLFDGNVIVAGQPLPTDLQLTENVVLPAGSILPFDYAYRVTKAVVGDVIQNYEFFEFSGRTLDTDFHVPLDFAGEIYGAGYETMYFAGDVVPAGTFLEFAYWSPGPGDVVPEWTVGIFGPELTLSTPINKNLAAGSTLDSPLTLTKGMSLKKGWVFAQDLKVGEPLHLEADFFQKGFSKYTLRAGGDIHVGGDTVIDVLAPVRDFTAASHAVASGASLDEAMTLLTPEMFLADDANGRFIQRKGASLSLTAMGTGDLSYINNYGQRINGPGLPYGGIYLGADTLLRVDDGQSITLTAADRMLVQGRIEARGGTVDLMAGMAESMDRDNPGSTPIRYDPTRALYIDDSAVIDVSGRAHVSTDQHGLRYAHVSKGGSIHAGGQYLSVRTLTESRNLTSAYVVVRPGALLDASGASAQVDYLTSAMPGGRSSLLIATDGGKIAFDSMHGVFLDGDLRANAGGAGALGGELSVTLSTPIMVDPGVGSNREIPDYMRRLRSIVVSQNYESLLPDSLSFGDCITGCWTPGQTIAESTASNAGVADLVGKARIGMDRVEAGGFDSLTLRTDDVVLFDGNVAIDLGRNLTLAGTIANLDLNGHVALSAAYVNFVAGGNMWGNDIVRQNPGTLALLKRPEIGTGSITITGGLVDMAGISFGIGGSIGLIGNQQLEYEYAAPRDINIVSRSDIRLTGGTVRSMSNISLTAAQIYPTSGATAAIYAGVYSYRLPGNSSIYQSLLTGSTVSFNALEGVMPAAPLSVYGTLTVGADIINQGGVLRAPLGMIRLGIGGDGYYPGPDEIAPGQTFWPATSQRTTRQVNLLPGSLTSVSGDGLVIPYGGTTDGLSWLRNGAAIDTTALYQGVTVIGALKADVGAVLDLSGGGMPSGAGFTSGRGGSVDILKTALANVNPAYAHFSDPDAKVYAIVPDYQNAAAPVAIDGHAQPVFGQQIIIPEGVPGIKAGTYMLLPAEYALMKGGYRVEIGKTAALGAGRGLTPMADGSYALGAYTSIAHSSSTSSMPVNVILSSADVVRTHSAYNETNFENFLINMPSTDLFGRPLPLMPRDGKQFMLALSNPSGDGSTPIFSFKGTGKFAAAEGGLGGSLSILPGNYGSGGTYGLDILDANGTPTEGNAWLYATDLNAVGATTMIVGGSIQRSVMGTNPVVASLTIQPGGGDGRTLSYTGFKGITVQSGATLAAPQILLVSDGSSDITVESGAVLTSVGKGAAGFDSASGFTIANGRAAILAVSNGLLELGSGGNSTGQIIVENGAGLYSDGTIAFASNGPVRLGEATDYGARYLSLSTGSVNIGTSAALELAAEQGILPGGIALTQAVLDRLILGGGTGKAPALERLILSASQSVNFYGSVNLDTRAINPDSTLQLVLNTSALYGHGGASDSATVGAATLVWNGMTSVTGPSYSPIIGPGQPGGVIANGPGTGSGTLNLVADRIVLGYQDGVTPSSSFALDRLALGFGTVNLTASDRIESNGNATLSFYQSQAVQGQPGTGGNLNITTPLLTGAGGSRVRYVAGGAIDIGAPLGWTPDTVRADAPMGGDITLTGASVMANTLIALPSGKLKLVATQGDVTLGSDARIDLAGKATDFYDQTRYSWGGDVELEAAQGNVTMARTAGIDLSADFNHAGNLKVTALEGTVSLDGAIKGDVRNGTGPANPALRNGGIDIRAGQLADFAGLNRRLTETGMVESRGFIIKSGDLVIGDEVKARNVSIAADGGSLTVNGRIDASGAKPGTIRLAALGNLTLSGGAVLDAHGAQLQVDSYGAPVEASNRATVELTSKGGTLSLGQGATLDLSSPDGVGRGRIDLNARRLGANDVAIAAADMLTIRGADSLSVNAFRTYEPTGGIIDQALMDGIHTDSDAFVNAAITNTALLGRMAGLRTYASAFHFRPGVELVSAAGGDLRVSGDLNMAGYRYASLNPATQRALNYADPSGGGYGSGEAGVLLIRAANDLDINGSITDGFGVPARTPDDNGWVLYPGAQGVNDAWIQEYRLPSAVTLGAGSSIPGTATLGYDVPVNGFQVAATVPLGAETRLSAAFTLGTDWVARADIRLPNGTLIARGSIMPIGTMLPIGTVMGAGTVMPGPVSIEAMTWPKGVQLPARFILSSALQLPAGAILPRDVNVLPNVISGLLAAPVTVTSAYELQGGASGEATAFRGGSLSPVVLDFDVTLRATQVRRNVAIPFGFENMSAYSTVNWTTTAPIWASKAAFEAGMAPIYATGQTVSAPLAAGSWFGAGSTLTGSGGVNIRAVSVPRGTPLNVFNVALLYLSQNITLAAGTTIAAGVTVVPTTIPLEQTRPVQADGTQGRIWATAPMLTQGSQSWSMRFVAGADIASADGRALRAASELARAGQTGDLSLSDRHFINPQVSAADGFTDNWLARMKALQVFSVVRTGTGSLDLLAGGSYAQYSLFGVYTAGTPSATIGGTTADGYNVYDQPRATLAGAGSLANPWIGRNFDGYADAIRDYQAWYPEHGGDLMLSVQGNMTGFQTGRNTGYLRPGSSTVTNWLWRQGGYGVTDGNAALGQDVPTAWWIQFGGYVPNNAASLNDGFVSQNAPMLIGFTGIGTLGGGNLTVSAGGNAGATSDYEYALGDTSGDGNRRVLSSTALDFAVASTGRVTSITRPGGFVTGGDLVQTGGGDMIIRIGGTLNPGFPTGADSISGNPEMAGNFINLRGGIDVTAGAIHKVTLVPGDSSSIINTRGNLALAGVGDPGAITQFQGAGTSLGYVDASGTFVRPDGVTMTSSFTLWRDDTAIHLFSAGGTLTPIMLAGSGNAARRDARYWYPPILTATAASGDIVWSGGLCGNDCNSGIASLELLPSPLGQVELLAMGSIKGGADIRQDGVGEFPATMPIALSGMSNSADLLPNPFHPVWAGQLNRTYTGTTVINAIFDGNAPLGSVGSNMAFQPDTAAGTLLKDRKDPALFYAVNGDIYRFSFGMMTWDGLTPRYISSGSATIRAGRDIINLGTVPAIGCGLTGPLDCRASAQIFGGAFRTAGLVVHNDPRDITLISAGRDIIYGNMSVAGPGNLIVEAGRNVYQGDSGRLSSLGPLFDLTPETRNGGAGITVLTGVGAGGPNYDAFARLYLNPANLADPAFPLVHPNNEGKVVHTYDAELTSWLSERYGFKADSPQAALAYFDTLSPVERGIFVRLAYYDELKAGGREYNEPEGPRFASYLRGRNAIAVLFPEKDANGAAISYAGDLTMFGGSGVRTLFGGNVELMVAGGQTLIGVGSVVPPSTAGVLSLGSGDIDIFSLRSVLLGQSRVFTTFGGDLFIWSVQGDINAGRGSKSTAVYQPPRRVYDMYGNVTLSPPTQNTGAGIATLNPIPEIPPGDIDLIAPLGTIDAGEAGIRVSGDVNLAALQVLNAANIQVQGDARGIPLPPVVNTSALTAASSASSAVVAEVARMAERVRPKPSDIPVIVSVRLLGFGFEP
ncbi:MAG TPA: filamentous hemagglutinin family protein [Sphingobium sp.]|uniref:filamentous haemagglutinin family protein n=1 Tax=Sphingobium sp. TaxID=1912891 RepID=UPI002ED28A0D